MDVKTNRLKAVAAAAIRQRLDTVIQTQPGDLRIYGESMGKLRATAAQQGKAGPQLFDKVLLDVPCSGLGVLAKRYGWQQPTSLIK